MGKVINWILGFTKIGKIVGSVQGFLSGKKTYLAGAAVAVPAMVAIITKFADQGSGYLLQITGTPEWDALMVGLGMMGLRAAVSKSVTPPATPAA